MDLSGVNIETGNSSSNGTRSERRGSIVGLVLPAPNQKYVPVDTVAKPIVLSSTNSFESPKWTDTGISVGNGTSTSITMSINNGVSTNMTNGTGCTSTNGTDGTRLSNGTVPTGTASRTIMGLTGTNGFLFGSSSTKKPTIDSLNYLLKNNTNGTNITNGTRNTNGTDSSDDYVGLFPRPHTSMGFAEDDGTAIPISFFPGEPTSPRTPDLESVTAIRPRRLFGSAVADEPESPTRLSSPSRWLQRRRERMARSKTNPDIFGTMDPYDRKKLIAEANMNLDEDELPSSSRREKTPRRYGFRDELGTSSSTSTNGTHRRHDSISRRVQELLNDKELKELLADSTKPKPTVASPTTRSSFFNDTVERKPKDRDNITMERNDRLERRSRFSRRSSINRSSLDATPFNDYGSMSKPKIVFGQKGDKPGELNWPRGIAVLGGGSFAVADSSNHRIQIFDNKGSLKKVKFHFIINISYTYFRFLVPTALWKVNWIVVRLLLTIE